MTTTTTDAARGTVTWVDLATPDLDGARQFYGELFGWSFEGGDDPSLGFDTTALLGGRKVAAMAREPSDGPPRWTVYLATPDADATAAAVALAGGAIVHPPMDIHDQGRLALFTDPSGAPFGVWQARVHRGAEVVGEPGAMCWHEVYSRDAERAVGFYRAALGLGATRLRLPEAAYWTLEAAGQVAFGAMQLSGPMADHPSHWNTYFAVADVDAAVAHLEALGGRTVAPAFDTPFGRLAFVADPAGAAFCIMKPERSVGP